MILSRKESEMALGAIKSGPSLQRKARLTLALDVAAPLGWGVF